MLPVVVFTLSMFDPNNLRLGDVLVLAVYGVYVLVLICSMKYGTPFAFFPDLIAPYRVILLFFCVAVVVPVMVYLRRLICGR